MCTKTFSYTHKSTMCGLKKLASAVFPESWKTLAERRRRKRTKNTKSLGYQGWLTEWAIKKSGSLTRTDFVRLPHTSCEKTLCTASGYLQYPKIGWWNYVNCDGVVLVFPGFIISNPAGSDRPPGRLPKRTSAAILEVQSLICRRVKSGIIDVVE